jgi:DNA-binding transcriptional LysR family regulator
MALDRFDAMRVFLTVAEEEGFAAAARRLRRSPPAITRTISALEEQLGARLVSRTTRVVRLTEAGERFAADVRRILAELEEAEANAASSHRGLRGGLRLTAPMMFGRLHVAPIALEFLSAHRELKVRALFTDRVVELAEEGIDVAVRIAALADSSLHAIRVGEVRMVTCASPRYLKDHRSLHHPRDLEAAGTHAHPAHEALAFHPSVGDVRWSFLEAAAPEPVAASSGPKAGAALRASLDKPLQIAPRARFIVNSTEVAMEAALAGHGVLRSLSYLVAPHLRSGALQLLLADFEPPPIPVHLVIPEGRQASARVRAFVELATARLRFALGPQGPASLVPLAATAATAPTAATRRRKGERPSRP